MSTPPRVPINVEVNRIANFPYGLYLEVLRSLSPLAEIKAIDHYDVAVLTQLLHHIDEYLLLCHHDGTQAELGMLDDKNLLRYIVTLFYGAAGINVLGRLAVTDETILHPPLPVYLTQGIAVNLSPAGGTTLPYEACSRVASSMSGEIGQLLIHQLQDQSPQDHFTWSAIPRGVTGNSADLLLMMTQLRKMQEGLGGVDTDYVMIAGLQALSYFQTLPGYVELPTTQPHFFQVQGVLRKQVPFPLPLLRGDPFIPEWFSYILPVAKRIVDRTISFEMYFPLVISGALPFWGVDKTRVPVTSKCVMLPGRLQMPLDYPFVSLEIVP